MSSEDYKSPGRHLAGYFALGFGVFRQRVSNMERGSERRYPSHPSFCWRRPYEDRAKIKPTPTRFLLYLREELCYILPSGLVRD